MKLKIGKTGIPTAKQRRMFYQYALDIYTEKVVGVTLYGHDLIDFGYCAIFEHVFSEKFIEEKLMLPELFKFKPKKVFYTCSGEKSTNKNQFWFPCGKNGGRIEILNKILASDF